jgi:hypothetical protein
MRKSAPILLSVTALGVISLACSLLPGIPVTAPTRDPNAVGTLIWQTMIAAATQTGAAIVPVDIASSPTATLTLTPEPPTLTPTTTLSATPLLPLTPGVPMISVSLATNCRAGPGKVYDPKGSLLVGEMAEVVGRDPTGNYWYIRNPDQANGFCWVWGEYATISGNTALLPVHTPAPTPTPVPTFDVRFDKLDACAGWWVELQVTNTGTMPLKSIYLVVKDIETDVDVSMAVDKFTTRQGCLGTFTKEVLFPGETATVSSPPFAYDPKGHKLRATVTVCADLGQKGACATQAIKFKP